MGMATSSPRTTKAVNMAMATGTWRTRSRSMPSTRAASTSRPAAQTAATYHFSLPDIPRASIGGGLDEPHYVAYPELVLSGYVVLVRRDYLHLESRSDRTRAHLLRESGVGSIQGRRRHRPHP